MGFEFFDMAYFHKEGSLSEKDYNVITRKLIKMMNPVRVQDIRKNMEFVSPSYMDYTKEVFNEFLVEDKMSIPLDLGSISIPLITSFNTNFFPNFELEYTNISGIINILEDNVFLEDINGESLKQLLNSNFHSLAIAAYNIEKGIKEKYKSTALWKISEQITVLVEFFIPVSIAANYDITIKVIFTLYS